MRVYGSGVRVCWKSAWHTADKCHDGLFDDVYVFLTSAWVEQSQQSYNKNRTGVCLFVSVFGDNRKVRSSIPGIGNFLSKCDFVLFVL